MENLDCVFCKIVSGDIPSYKIFEDEDVLAFLDVAPVSKGHALVVSKKHYDNFLSTPKDIMHKVMDVAQRIGQIQVQMMNAKGVNILSNCYKEAGQSVFHFHVHVIPRYSKHDNFILEMKGHDENLNLPAIAKQIKDELK